MLGGTGSPGGGEDLLTVTIVPDGQGYGMKVSGDNPVYVQSVKEHGAAWRAGLRAGDRILRVDGVSVLQHTHQQVVHMIRAHPTTVLTVNQNSSRIKTPITAPLPVNSEKQRQLDESKLHTVRLMLDQESKYIRELRNELAKVPDVRKQAQLESSEQRCSILQHEIDTIMGMQPNARNSSSRMSYPTAPAPAPAAAPAPKQPSAQNTGFLSGLPRSLSNLTGQSIRNLRNNRQKQDHSPPLLARQNSHNHTVPVTPTTCLDNCISSTVPPPLPPRSIERPRRIPMSPVNPLANPKPSSSLSPTHKYSKPFDDKKDSIRSPMHRSVPSYNDAQKQFRRSSHSLDGELDGPQPNSIALQMNYPLVNAPPPPLKTDHRSGVPVLHVRSQSSPEKLDHALPRCTSLGGSDGGSGEVSEPPPGTPPPPYARNTLPCADPQRAIISMEEDDSPASDNSTYSGLFSNLRSVRDSKARTAVLLNWLLGERRSASAGLVLVLTDGYSSAAGVSGATLRRWAYEIHSTFIMPAAVLQLSGVDENMANEIEHVLINEYEKEDLLRNVFRKARQKAKDELSQQLLEFQVKRQVGLGTLYGPEDELLHKCIADKQQEQVVVERIMCQRLTTVAQETAASGAGAGSGGVAGSQTGGTGGGSGSAEAGAALLSALIAAALCLHCRPASVTAAVGGLRPSFLLRDKPYKQRVKQIAKQSPQPFIVRGHHLQLQALTSVAHCHRCDNVIWGLAPQAYVCTDCKLRVHRWCARHVDEPCCLDGDHHNNRISRFMERIHSTNQANNQESSEKRKKAQGAALFINMERSFRKIEDEPPWEPLATSNTPQGESRREGSTEETAAADGDADTSDAVSKETSDKENSWRSAVGAVGAGGRGVNRAESCRERDAPRRGKHRNASDPNRLTAHNNHDLEPGAATAPSGSSSNSSLSSRSNESNTVAAEHQASQSDWSEEDEPLAPQWADSLPPQVLDTLGLPPRIRKRQDVIHELIVSESSHVRWLKVLNFVFLRSLENQPGLLPPDELRALFPNLPGVRERHARLYNDLRAARNEAVNHVVQIRPIADAILNTLGDPGYATCLSRFCRGQRMALETLRERRRKNKELHQFIHIREQNPQCGRLQLRDLLACVWQRLTKYQLLLESVVKTVEDSDNDTEEDVARLQQALQIAKQVLHAVDTAIRSAENEHRLRTIQNKLEVRASGPEWEELRRLDLSTRSLRMEGELAIRNDSNKKINVLALMLSDSLILLQREGDKFILKPITQPSQQGLLSPLIKWDKVLFRPNAAVKNTFFLMNINGVQMHELSANTPAEYATWVKYIQESPLAKLTDLKSNITPSHQATKSNDDSGINVSRNPSDASEKSTSTVPADDAESDRERASLERRSTDREDRGDIEDKMETEDAGDKADRSAREDKSVEREGRNKEVERDKDEIVEREERHRVRRPTTGRITQHLHEPPALLEPSAAVVVNEPAAECIAHTAHTVLTPQERLRRLNSSIEHAMREKSALVAELLGVPIESFSQICDLAVADTLGQVDVSGELRAVRLDRSSSVEDEGVGVEGGAVEVGAAPAPPSADMHQLLLAAHAQANQLTEAVNKVLTVSETATVSARATRARGAAGAGGRCDSCRRRLPKRTSTRRDTHSAHPAHPAPQREPSEICENSVNGDPARGERGERPEPLSQSVLDTSVEKDVSFDMLSELQDRTSCPTSGDEDDEMASVLAMRLVGLSCGVQSALARALGALPALHAHNDALRRELAAERDRSDHLLAQLTRHKLTDYSETTEDLLYPKDNMDHVMQDQPSNGG